MLSERFNILELTDLALRVPEIGAVNFNILHTVITALILELDLTSLKPACYIEDETLAQTAITKARVNGPHGARKPSKVLTVKEMRDKVRKLTPQEEPVPHITQEDTQESTGFEIPEDVGKETQFSEETPATLGDESTGGDEDKKKTISETGAEAHGKLSSGQVGKGADESDQVMDIAESEEVTDAGKSEEVTDAGEIEEVKDEDKSEEMKDTGESEEVKAEDKSDEVKDADESDQVMDVGESEEVTVAAESEEITDAGKSEEVTDAGKSEEVKDTGESEEVKDEDKSEEMKDEDKRVTDETTPAAEDYKKTEVDEKDHMTIDELQETARDLMEQSADIFLEKAALVTDALKILEDEELLDAEPARVMEEMWRATNINRRMEAAEAGLRELSALVDVMLDKVEDVEEQSDEVMNKTKVMLDEITKFLKRIQILEETSKTLSLRIDDCNEQRANEVERLEGMLNEMKRDHEETKTALENLQSSHDDMAERVAYKEDLEEAKSQILKTLEGKMKDMRKLLREVEDTLVRKEDFMEIVTRVEDLEESKVSREELGRLLEPGFIDSFLEEQANLRTELEELKITVAELEENFNALKTRIDEEIVKTMESNFAEIHAILDGMNAKLDLLDPDEINDSFANLEEQAAMIIKELEEIKTAAEQFQKEARINFNKISNVNELLNRLEQTKVDKTKMYELLEMKADMDLLMNKLDRNEFVAVVGDMRDNLERLTITVKLNEEDMNSNFLQVRQELTLKMYTEDFITATEPTRNRIKALMYELERVKQIALTHLFPDAPGVVKCISCKRGAHLAGPKYRGDANVELLQEIATGTVVKVASKKLSRYQTGTESSQQASDVKLPPIDLDSVPIPPADKEREKDALRLPMLFATARPRIGLAHEERRSTIDKRLAAYFATRPVRPCGGEYTRTLPQQRGSTFVRVMIPQSEKEEVLLDGIDKKIYRGAIYDGHEVDTGEEQQQTDTKEDESAKDKPVIASLKEPKRKKGFIKPDLKSHSKRSESRDSVSTSVVSLHVNDEPLLGTSSLSSSSQNMLLPSSQFQKTEKHQ